MVADRSRFQCHRSKRGRCGKRQAAPNACDSGVDEETKDLIERAADPSGRKVSDFCVTALTEAARRTIAEHEMVLSDRDRQAFFDALVNPPKPSERLKRALAEHKGRVAS